MYDSKSAPSVYEPSHEAFVNEDHTQVQVQLSNQNYRVMTQCNSVQRETNNYEKTSFLVNEIQI